MRVRYRELEGMLPAVIEQVQALLDKHPDAKIVRGYDSRAGSDSLFSWGAACQIELLDKVALTADAAKASVDVDDKGVITYTGGRTIKEFKSFRVGGDLKMQAVADIEMEVEKDG